MASPVGAILFLLPFTLPIFHFHLPLPRLLPDAAALSSMQGLPRSGNSSAQTSASLHPPAALRLRCLPFTGDMGVHGLCGRVPDSAGNVSPWIASAQTDANLSAHLHRLPTPPPYLRRMRLLPGRGAGVGWQMMLLVVRGTVPANHRARFKNVIYL